MDSNYNYIKEVAGIYRDDIASATRRARLLMIGGTAILLFAAGTWVMAIVKVIPGNLTPSLISIVGAFVSVCGLIPFKEITPRRLALARFTHLGREYERIKDLPDEERERRLSQINKLLSELQ